VLLQTNTEAQNITTKSDLKYCGEACIFGRWEEDNEKVEMTQTRFILSLPETERRDFCTDSELYTGTKKFHLHLRFSSSYIANVTITNFENHFLRNLRYQCDIFTDHFHNLLLEI
jgi:hypothetical protein